VYPFDLAERSDLRFRVGTLRDTRRNESAGRSMQMIVESDPLQRCGNERKTRTFSSSSLPHPLLLLPRSCLSFFIRQSPLRGSPSLARGPGVLPPPSPLFYFRVRDALVCYLSRTLTSLLAAIILINISPIGGRRGEGLYPIPRSLPEHSLPLTFSSLLSLSLSLSL